MAIVKNYGDPTIYRNYYKAQAGYALPGYHGAPVMYGAGVGGIFRSLFRKAVPLLRRGLEIIKPHVKTAAQNIAKDVVGHVSRAVLEKVGNTASQEGAGLMYIKRRKRKRNTSYPRRTGPPKPFKRRALTRRASHKRKSKRKPGQKRRRALPAKRDIF